MRHKLLLASALTCALSSIVQAAPLVVNEPWIRAMPSNSRVIPIFFGLENITSSERVLVAMYSPAGEVEIYETVPVDGMMKMQPIMALPIAAGQKVMLKPGGYHGMMSSFTHGVPAEGETVAVTLVYANGEEQQIHVKVIRRAKTKTMQMPATN